MINWTLKELPATKMKEPLKHLEHLCHADRILSENESGLIELAQCTQNVTIL